MLNRPDKLNAISMALLDQIEECGRTGEKSRRARRADHGRRRTRVQRRRGHQRDLASALVSVSRLWYNQNREVDMAKEAMIRARIEPQLKAEVEDIFQELGLSITEAITLFYKQVRLNRGLPFKVHPSK